MRHSSPMLVTITLAVILSACSQPNSNTTVEGQGSTEGLNVSNTLPENVRQEIHKWYGELPSSFHDNAAKTVVIFTTQDGKLYSSDDRTKFRTGKLKSQNGNDYILMDDSKEMIPYMKDEFKPNAMSPQSTDYYMCKASNGAYYRSWSSSGYTGVSSGMLMGVPNYPGLINGYKLGIYNYIGGQASNSSSEVDAGITYQPQTGTTPTLGVFTSANGNFIFTSGGNGLSFNQTYTGKLEVTGANALVFRMNKPDGTTLLVNLTAYGFNLSGSDQYFKRMATTSSGGFPNPYTGTPKYYITNDSTHANSKLAYNSGGTNYYQNWSSSSVSSSDCRNPTSTMTQLVSGTATSDLIKVYIDMSR